MSNYVVSDSSMASVADAIRAKGNTSAALEYPDGGLDGIGGHDMIVVRVGWMMGDDGVRLEIHDAFFNELH